jgi:SAM-dependent methyltransferase
VKPQTWHYGIVARWWAQFSVGGPEIDYFSRLIEESGQPALDVACGTGRLLLPCLRAGLDVDGCDVSEDMLALCRANAQREGFSPNLYAQAMHELDLPRRYRTIIVCGGLGLGSSREQDMEALRRLYEHLEPGGLLALDNQVPYSYGSWRYWRKDARDDLPRPWPPRGERRRASDGTEYELRTRLLALDPLAQQVTMEIHGEQWRDEKLVADEKHVLTMNLYFADELVLMLERAGFTDVEVRGGYTDAEPTPDDDFLVFIATKPQAQAGHGGRSGQAPGGSPAAR